MAKRKNKGQEQDQAVGAAIAGAMKLPEGVTVKRHVTMPSLVVKEPGRQVLIHIVDAMRISTIKQKEKDTKREPATICTVVQCETGEYNIFLVPAVVKANLERDYPNDSYVGKQFAIQNKGKRTPTQRYNDFAITEVEYPGMEKFTTKK